MTPRGPCWSQHGRQRVDSASSLGLGSARNPQQHRTVAPTRNTTANIQTLLYIHIFEGHLQISVTMRMFHSWWTRDICIFIPGKEKAPGANSSPQRGKAIEIWKEANFVFDEKYNWTLKSCSSLEDLKGPWPGTSLGHKTPSGLGRSLKNRL